MYHKNYVPQVDEEDCGVAALAMILKYFGTVISLAKLRELTRTTITGTTIYGIKKAAEYFNLEVLPIKADNKLFDVEHLPVPFIVHVIKDNGLFHYYVVREIRNDVVIIADPDPEIGIKKMKVNDLLSEWTGSAIFFTTRDNYEPQKNKISGLIGLTSQLLIKKKMILGIIISAFIVLVINIISSLALQSIIDTFIPKLLKDLLSLVVFSLLVLYFFNAVFSFLEGILISKLGKELSANIVLTFIKHLFNLPISFFLNRKTGDIVSRFNDTGKIIDALATSVVTLCLDVIIVLTMGIFLWFQSKILFLIILAALPIYLAIILSFTLIFEKINKSVMKANAQVSSSIIESIKGIETIKALNSESRKFGQIQNEFLEYLDKNYKYGVSENAQNSIKQFIHLSLNIIIIWMGAREIMTHNFMLGQLISFNALLGYFTNSLQNIINLQAKFQSAKVANNRLNEIMLVREEEHGSSHLISQYPKFTLNHVNCSYGFDKAVIKNVNMEINAGEKIAVVGASGSGKSTLAKLLVKFLDINSGQIALDNININNISGKELRSYVNYVPQHPALFSGSILKNLTLGIGTSAKLEDIRIAARIACIDKEICQMPMGYNTMISENGESLSGGQKQRLAIARAILSPANILILDESTSGLDSVTENTLIENLLKQTDKTIIFIAHRLTIASKVNKVFVLKQGEIVEEGTHKELLARKNYYYKFWLANKIKYR